MHFIRYNEMCLEVALYCRDYSRYDIILGHPKAQFEPFLALVIVLVHFICYNEMCLEMALYCSDYTRYDTNLGPIFSLGISTHDPTLKIFACVGSRE